MLLIFSTFPDTTGWEKKEEKQETETMKIDFVHLTSSWAVRMVAI